MYSIRDIIFSSLRYTASLRLPSPKANSILRHSRKSFQFKLLWLLIFITSYNITLTRKYIKLSLVLVYKGRGCLYRRYNARSMFFVKNCCKDFKNLALSTGFEPVSIGRKPTMLVHYTTRALVYKGLGDVGRENPLALTTGFQPRTSWGPKSHNTLTITSLLHYVLFCASPFLSSIPLIYMGY